MLTRKKSIAAAASIMASALIIASLVNYTKSKPIDSQTNNVVLEDQTEQNPQPSSPNLLQSDISVPAISETNSSEVQDSSPADEEPKIIAYTVKSGDTLESIAAAYKLKAKGIAESNSLALESTLNEGQVLEFPSVEGVIYKIKSGETLWDLALTNKVDFDTIVAVNKLEAPEKLKLNQKIIFPGVETVKSIPIKPSNRIVASNTPLSRGGSIPAIANVTASMPTSGKISSYFGPRNGKLHEGIDISAPTGTDVFASMDGTVSFSGWDGAYGNLVIIDHGNGLKSYYAHNSKLLVTAGKAVSRGDHIADVGSTGNSTGPHCHFEIRENGTPVNPYNYLK
jgi:murein DD-endopeptidase MepM/ murein hydrolase activator NlpD